MDGVGEDGMVPRGAGVRCRRAGLSRRGFLRAGGLTAGAAALTGLAAACSPDGPPRQSQGNGGGGGGGSATTVKFWTVVEGPDDEAFQRKMFEKFNKDHPDVAVEMQVFPPAQYGNAMQLAFTGGEDGPDVFRVGPGARLNDAYPKGWAAPLDDYLTDDFRNRFPDYCYLKTEVSPLYRDGSAYAVPRADPYVEAQRPLLVNGDLLEKAGFSEPPKTWSEFAEVAGKITRDGGGKVFGTSVVTPNQHLVIQSFAGPQPYLSQITPPINLLDGKPMLSHPSMVASVEFWQQLNKDKVLTPGFESWKAPQAIQHMAGGRLAMYIFPLFHVNQLRQTNPDLNLVLAEPPMPDDGRKGSIAPVDAAPFWLMSAQSKVKDAAWQVLDFLGSVEFQQAAFLEVKQMSIMEQVYEGIEVDPDTKRLREMAADLVRTRPEPNYRNPKTRDFYTDLQAKGPKPPPADVAFAALTRGTPFKPEAAKYDEAMAAAMEKLFDEHDVSAEDFTFADWDPMQEYQQGD